MLPLRAGLGALFAAVAMLSVACGTDASGVDSCRRIEQARCRKAPACPDLAVNSVEACSGFARDRCLHGLAVPDPGVARVDQCVKAIDETNSCSLIATPELDPACRFLLPDATDAGPDAAENAHDAADGSIMGSDADAATISDASAIPGDADATVTASDASDSSAIPSDTGAGDAALESGSVVDGAAG